jgi:hypothetical protein
VLITLCFLAGVQPVHCQEAMDSDRGDTADPIARISEGNIKIRKCWYKTE